MDIKRRHKFLDEAIQNKDQKVLIKYFHLINNVNRKMAENDVRYVYKQIGGQVTCGFFQKLGNFLTGKGFECDYVIGIKEVDEECYNFLEQWKDKDKLKIDQNNIEKFDKYIKLLYFLHYYVNVHNHLFGEDKMGMGKEIQKKIGIKLYNFIKNKTRSDFFPNNLFDIDKDDRNVIESKYKSITIRRDGVCESPEIKCYIENLSTTIHNIYEKYQFDSRVANGSKLDDQQLGYFSCTLRFYLKYLIEIGEYFEKYRPNINWVCVALLKQNINQIKKSYEYMTTDIENMSNSNTK